MGSDSEMGVFLSSLFIGSGGSAPLNSFRLGFTSELSSPPSLDIQINGGRTLLFD